MNIAIPEYFALYNDEIIDKGNPEYAKRYAELTKDPFTKCAGICLGCGRRDCPNRMEEKENFPLRFADMTDRPLSYGYARIFSKADVK